MPSNITKKIKQMNVVPNQPFLKSGHQISNFGQQQLPRHGCEIARPKKTCLSRIS